MKIGLTDDRREEATEQQPERSLQECCRHKPVYATLWPFAVFADQTFRRRDWRFPNWNGDMGMGLTATTHHVALPRCGCDVSISTHFQTKIRFALTSRRVAD